MSQLTLSAVRLRRTSLRGTSTGTMDEQLSVSRFLMLGALETLLNQAIEHDPRARERLRSLHGTAVRVRAEKPMLVLYLLIYEDGIEVLPEYEGQVDVRIRGRLGAMLQWLLAPNSPMPEEDRIRILGNEEQLDLLAQMISEFSLWGIVRNWLDDHVRLNELLTMLRREDPEWLERLQDLPETVRMLAREVGHQRLLQEEILEEIRGLKRGLRLERRLDLAFILFGVALLLAALASAGGQLPLLVDQITSESQTLLFASLGLTLLVSRLLFGHRYD